jgi:hypothetical protein
MDQGEMEDMVGIKEEPSESPILEGVLGEGKVSCIHLSSSSSFILKAEWTPFQTHCYAKELVALGIESRTSGLTARNSDH